VSYYLTELAGLLHRYYTVNQVLAAPDADTVRARLHLLAATAQVIRNGLDLLGVDAPEAM
jgi:arginyl-tRNA synthetase